MTIAVLALDLGTNTGWALRRPDGVIESGVAKFTPAGHEGDGLRFLRFRAFLHETKRRVDAMGGAIGLVEYEHVDFIRPGQVYSAHVWGGMWATLTAWCEHHRIAYRGIPQATLKKRITGRGSFKKGAAKEAVRAAVNLRLSQLYGRRGLVTDHNEADALALLLTIEPERIAA